MFRMSRKHFYNLHKITLYIVLFILPIYFYLSEKTVYFIYIHFIDENNHLLSKYPLFIKQANL